MTGFPPTDPVEPPAREVITRFDFEVRSRPDQDPNLEHQPLGWFTQHHARHVMANLLQALSGHASKPGFTEIILGYLCLGHTNEVCAPTLTYRIGVGLDEGRGEPQFIEGQCDDFTHFEPLFQKFRDLVLNLVEGSHPEAEAS